MTPTISLLKDKLSNMYKKNAELRVQKMTQEFSSRQYYRICQNDGVKCHVLQVTEAFESEWDNPFICAQKIYQYFGIPVPDILMSSPELGWVLLEDLGDVFLQKSQSVELYKESLRCLVELSQKVKRSSLMGSAHLEKAPHWDWAFDFEKLQQEMAYTAEHLLEGLCGISGKTFIDLCAENSRFLSERPRFFCHRDYHSRNLMIHEGRVVVIDFQDSRMGPLSYDVVSLLWDPYVPLSDESRNFYLSYWMEQIVKTGDHTLLEVVSNLNEFGQELERMKLQRMLKAAGSYAGLWTSKKRTNYLKYIEPALATSLKVLESLQKQSWMTQKDESLLLLLLDLQKRVYKEVEENEKA